MRGYEMVRRSRGRALTAVTMAVLGVLLALASPAAIAKPQAGPGAAGPNTDPVRSWSLSDVNQGDGEVLRRTDFQQGGTLHKSIVVGSAAFDLQRPSPYDKLPTDRAFGSLFSSADGTRGSVLSEAPSLNFDQVSQGLPKGSIARLDEFQSYVKQARTASLRITLSDAVLRTVDANGPLGPMELQSPDFAPIQSFVKFEVRAYAASTGNARTRDFFRVSGGAYLEGHEGAWRSDTMTFEDSSHPLWDGRRFTVDPDADHSGTGSFAVKRLTGPITLKVPLTRLHRGELFAVHVSLYASTFNDRGDESGAQAFIEDPQHVGPGLHARGLAPRGKPRFKEPRVTPPPPARCPAGPRPRSGRLQLSDGRFAVDEAATTPLVLVRRIGGSQGAASVTLRTAGGSATSGGDFTPTTTRVTFADGDTTPRLVEIPIREDHAVESPEQFTVSLAHPQCATLGKQRSASVTIVDDDQPPPPPPPTFTIGGTVDGLQGSGLVLSNLGAEVPVSANGTFTFPGTATSGQGYEVNVKTQPSNPDQICTIEHGAGQVSSANVTDIAVHCTAQLIPPGLDSTFGDHGRVSTPVGGNGQGEAVVIQSSGQIVTAGWRTVGTGIDTDFALTRHNTDGSLDTGFGTGGIATTDLGGPDDQANDAALLPDGGIVAVGRTDALGILKTAFGVVRYLPGGTPNTSFDGDGIVTTPIFGKGAVANAVAVQPDGKIVVAGFADQVSGINSDFALVRYNPDGSLDTSFDGDGIVTTDLSGQDDDARALVIQPDGKIVVAGTAGEDIALARYTTDGKLDNTFGSGGTRITDLGFVDVANGVAITATGQIVIAGYTIGAKLNNDFLLARYNTNGTLDTTFGTGGTVKTDLGGGDDFAEDLTVDAQGRIILVGRASSPTILDMALVRYHSDGTPDPSFDGDGILTADFHGKGDFGQDLAIDSQGRIVVAGYSGAEFALMRVNP